MVRAGDKVTLTDTTRARIVRNGCKQEELEIISVYSTDGVAWYLARPFGKDEPRYWVRPEDVEGQKIGREW